jgi:hypothetical protein
MSKRKVRIGLGLILFGALLAWLCPKASAAPYICYQPQHMQDLLCAGTNTQLPPGYSFQDPGTWQPWPKYAPIPGGRY